MANIFDQFDSESSNSTPPASAGGNIFDQFDEQQPTDPQQPDRRNQQLQSNQELFAQFAADNQDFINAEYDAQATAFRRREQQGTRNLRAEHASRVSEGYMERLKINPTETFVNQKAVHDAVPSPAEGAMTQAADLVKEFKETGSLRPKPRTTGRWAELTQNSLGNNQAWDGVAADGSQERAFVDGAAQGATFGFSDEILGGIRSLLGEESYQEARDKLRAQSSELREENPSTYLGGELLGSMGVALPAAAPRAGATFAQNAGRLAGVGAAEGALSGLGASEADLVEGDFAGAALDTGIGAAIGGVAAPVLGGAVDGVTRVLSRLPFSGLNRLQGTEQQRATNSLREHIQQEVDAGRMNKEQILSEIEMLRSGAVDGVDVSLADLDALQRVTTEVNSRAGRPVNLGQADQANLQAGGVSPTYGSFVDNLNNRQGTQQQGIIDTVSPDVVAPQAGANQATPVATQRTSPAQVDPTNNPTGVPIQKSIRENEVVIRPDSHQLVTNPVTGIEETVIVGQPNLVQMQSNMKSDLNSYTSTLYDNAYKTSMTPRTYDKVGSPNRNLPPREIPNDLWTKPAFKEAWKSGRKAARNNNDTPSQFQELDYTKRALDAQIARADGGTRADLIEMRTQLNGVLETSSPDFADANAIQATYRRDFIAQFDNSASYFNMDADAAANLVTSVARGDMDIAAMSMGREIRNAIESGARNSDGSLLSPQQINNYTRMLEPENWSRGESSVGKMMSTEARTERTRRLADITTSKGIGAEAESALRSVIGQDDAMLATIMTAVASPSIIAVPFMVNRIVASEASRISQQGVFRELQKELYRALPGSRTEQKKYIDDLFSMQFEKVPTDVLRTFINTFVVGSSNMVAQEATGEVRPISR
ncbi:hypothetical protein RCJ22_15610 [Vibrio sp. FNV 38]|nr:hypothetical protein [Vibrio sp. FNV 38]